ncbi:MAG: GAF domain-containing protein [Pseudomonadota bacterium]
MKERERIKKLARLNKASAKLNLMKDKEKFLDEVLTQAHNIFKYNSCAILRINALKNNLYIEKQIGYNPKVEKILIKIGEGITGQVAQNGKPIIVSDVTNDKRYIKGINGGLSEMAVPMKYKNRLIGVMDVESTEKGFFNKEDLELFNIYSHQVASAYLNVDLYDELQRKNESLEKKLKEVEVMNRIAKRINSNLDLDVLLKQILRLCHEALKFSKAGILLFNEKKDELELVSSYGYKLKEVSDLKIAKGKGITGWVAKSGDPLLIKNVNESKRFIGDKENIYSSMAVPLIVKNKLIGVLNADSVQPKVFTDSDLEFFTYFASHVAIAIQNAELFLEVKDKNKILHSNISEIEKMNLELKDYSNKVKTANKDLQKRMKDLVSLTDASKAISSSLNLDSTLSSIMKMSTRIINASASMIKVIDKETNETKIKVHYSPIIKKLSNSMKSSKVPKIRRELLKSILSFPLIVGDKTIGSFEIGSIEIDAFDESEKNILQTLAGQGAVAIENARLFEDIQRTYYETIKSLVHALEARDAYTKGHSERVTTLSLKIARILKLSKEDLRVLNYAGILHDIGKIGIADSVLNKKEALTAADWEIIEKHPFFGDTILGPIKFLEEAQDIILHHHERLDGKGYPHGLIGKEIPIASRIIAVADSYDAMTSKRVYRTSMKKKEAIDEIKKNSGSQFDPNVVKAFLKVIQPGSMK